MMTNLQSSAFVARTTQLLSSVARLRLLLVMLLTLMASTAWGQTTTTYTFSSKSWAASPANWTSGKDSNQMQSGRGVQVTTGATGANATSPKSFTNVSKIVVTYSTNASAGAGTIKIKIGSNTEVSQNVTKTGGTTDRTLTYNFSPNQTGSVKVTVTCSTNSIYLKSIAITEAAATVNHTVTWKVNGETYTTGSPSTSVSGGGKVTKLPTNPTLDCSGRTFVGWSNQEVTDGNKPSVLFTTAANSPAINDHTTFHAVFATATGGGSTTDTYDWESTSTGNWTIDSNIARTASQGVSSSYAGKINTANTYVTYTKKVAVTEFSFQFKRTSNNTNYNVYIETSTDNSNWSAAATYTMNSFGNGTYTSKSQTFDGKTELYVRFHCYNTTAVRYVDNVSITYGSSSYFDYTTSCATQTAVYLIPKNSDFWMAHLRRIFGCKCCPAVASHTTRLPIATSSHPLPQSLSRGIPSCTEW